MEAAERAGAMITEQIRGITEAAEHRAGDLRREAEADAESLDKDGRDAARGVLERIDRLETAVQQLIGSLRHEADALSRLVGRGQSARSDRPSRSAPPVEPLALQSGSVSADASPADAVTAPAPGDGDSAISTEPAERTEGAPTLDGGDETGGEVAVDHEGPVAPEPEAEDLEREPELPILADPEPEFVSEPEQSATSSPLDAAEVPPPAEPPEAEVVVGSGDALESPQPEHAPTVDHAPTLEDEQLSDVAEPALEDEQRSDIAEAEPYSEVEPEPPLDGERLETHEPPLEPQEPETLEPLSLDETEIAPPVSEEPEGIDESREDESTGPGHAAEVSPPAEPPEAEVVVGSGDPFEARGPEHAPTVDHPEPALEDEQLSDLEAPEAEPYPEVEEPLADEPYSEAGGAPLETLPPEAPEPRAGAEQPEAPEPLSELSTGVDAYSEEDVELVEAGSPLEEEQFPDSDLEPPPAEDLVEAGPIETIEEPEPGSTEDPYAEPEDDVEVESRHDAAPGGEAGGIDDASERPEKPRRRGLRSLFRRRSAASESPEDEQGPQDFQSPERAFEAVEGSTDSVSGDPVGSGIEGPPPPYDEWFPDSPPIVVQEGWWEQRASEEATPTGDPPADVETDVGDGTDAVREDPTSQPVTPHQDALDAPHRGGEPLEEALEKEALPDPSENERDANVGVSLGDIQPSGAAASAETPRCVVCNRVHEGSFEAAEAEGWHVDVAGAEAICERCQAAGWRLQEASDRPERRGRFFGRAGGSL